MHDPTVTSRRALPLATALLLLTSGCAKPPQQGGFTPPPMPVEVAVVAPQAVSDRFTALGSIEAVETIEVVAEIDGTVVRLPFTEGGDARAGQVLAQLDDSQLAASLSRAVAQRDHAQSNLARIENLVGQSILPPQSGDDARSDLKVAQADVALAQARLAKATIRAPFAGVLGSRRVSPGAFLHAGDVITDLSQVDEVKVKFTVPERFLATVKPGAQVDVGSPAFPDSPLTGSISLIDPVLDEATRSAHVTARAANPHRLFKPGMSADVAVTLSERPQALTVPSEAVFYEGAQALVYVIKDDGTVTRAALTLGTRLADAVEVVSGLEAGAKIVRAGHQKLFEGAKVMPMGQGAPQAPGTQG